MQDTKVKLIRQEPRVGQGNCLTRRESRFLRDHQATENSSPVRLPIGEKLAELAPPSHVEFIKDYFHRTKDAHGGHLVANTNQAAKSHGTSSLFIHANLRSNDFARLMRNPEIASKREEWLLLLGNFINAGLVHNRELVWLDHDTDMLQRYVEDKKEYAALELADRLPNNDLNEASRRLDEMASIVVAKTNFPRDLERAGINKLTANQKFYILLKLAEKYLYQGETRELAQSADPIIFAKKVNLLKDFPLAIPVPVESAEVNYLNLEQLEEAIQLKREKIQMVSKGHFDTRPLDSSFVGDVHSRFAIDLEATEPLKGNAKQRVIELITATVHEIYNRDISRTSLSDADLGHLAVASIINERYVHDVKLTRIIDSAMTTIALDIVQKKYA